MNPHSIPLSVAGVQPTDPHDPGSPVRLVLISPDRERGNHIPILIHDRAGVEGLKYGDSVKITIEDNPVPSAPQSVSARHGNASAVVTFEAPADNGGTPITGYRAEANPGGVTAMVSGPEPAPISVGGLANGTSYTFTVVALNAAGTSAPSDPSAPVTPAAPSPQPAKAQVQANPAENTPKAS